MPPNTSSTPPDADAAAAANGHTSARRRAGNKTQPLRQRQRQRQSGIARNGGNGGAMGTGWRWRPAWWSAAAVAGILRRHPAPVAFGCGLLAFMGMEYNIPMVPPAAPPLDLGFAATAPLHAALAARPALNSLLAALNTVFVAMQAAYILWAILVERRPRAAIAALMMFTCRGVLGCSTQLPLPEGFLGSGMDFPVGNVSFFLFFSGHVAGAVIASVDMRRVGRRRLACLYDALNLLQGIRLLASRGHYTIDLAVGVGAGLLFDLVAGKYLGSKGVQQPDVSSSDRHCCTCQALLASAP